MGATGRDGWTAGGLESKEGINKGGFFCGRVNCCLTERSSGFGNHYAHFNIFLSYFESLCVSLSDEWVQHHPQVCGSVIMMTVGFLQVETCVGVIHSSRDGC